MQAFFLLEGAPGFALSEQTQYPFSLLTSLRLTSTTQVEK